MSIRIPARTNKNPPVFKSQCMFTAPVTPDSIRVMVFDPPNGDEDRAENIGETELYPILAGMKLENMNPIITTPMRRRMIGIRKRILRGIYKNCAFRYTNCLYQHEIH